MPTIHTVTLALVLLLHTVPSGSAHIRVVQAQPAPVARPMSSSAQSRATDSVWWWASTIPGSRSDTTARITGRSHQRPPVSIRRAPNCRTRTRAMTAAITSALTSPDIKASVSVEERRQRVLSTPSTLRKSAGQQIGAGVDRGWIRGPLWSPPAGGGSPDAPRTGDLHARAVRRPERFPAQSPPHPEALPGLERFPGRIRPPGRRLTARARHRAGILPGPEHLPARDPPLTGALPHPGPSPDRSTSQPRVL